MKGRCLTMKKHNNVLKKLIVLFLGLVVLSSMMCACQTQQTPQDNKTADNSTDTDKTSDAFDTPITGTEDIPQWKTAYLDFLETEKDWHRSYALAYIDDDDIPELYLSGDCEATGDSVCSYKNGAVIKQSMNRIGNVRYIERSGNIINQNGNMGYVLTHVYKLDENGFTLMFEATSVEHVELLENGEYALRYEYSIGNNHASKSEYDAAVNGAFDFDNSINLYENSANYDSICQQIIDCD